MKRRALPPTDARALRARLAELQSTVRAAAAGQLDSLVLTDGAGRARGLAVAGDDQEYRDLVTGTSEGIVVVERDGTVAFADRRFARFVGARLERVIGASILRWVAPPGSTRLEAALRARSGARARRLTAEIVRPDGSRRPARISVAWVPRERRCSLIVTDLTERARAQAVLALAQAETHALARANEELESFGYSVAHDLRTPLRSIEGFSATIAADHETLLSDRSRSDLERVRAAADRMGAMIDDLLTLSRVSRVPIEPEQVDLSAIAREEVAGLHDADPREVAVSIAPAITARADPRLVRPLIANLLSNAWKFTRQTPHPSIGLSVRDEAASRVFAVSDNGVGFDMARAALLFAPFQRLHSEDDFPGHGIGLATVKRIVSRHGGRLWAESAPGEGSTFFFTLGTDAANTHPLPATAP